MKRLSICLALLACASLTARGEQLSVSIRDASSGKPTAAAVRLYDSAGRLLVPKSALDLRSMGYLYAPGALIHYADWTSPQVRSRDPYFGSSYFRDKHPAMTACFFVDGGFDIALAAGPYRLMVNKGLEYRPVDTTIAVESGQHTRKTVVLERWVDMAGRGWYSGDGHVHIQRTGREDNGAALLWAAAEDIRVANILAMGDAEQTYYPQYAFGTAGRAVQGDQALLPGQEEPRTQYLGHTLHLNTPGLIREAARYYDYPPTFERARKVGALSGFAHVGRRRWSFHVDDGLSLLAPLGLVDFVEIAQMGYIGVNVWYEFLNLGFRLTAMAGSDVPWGGTIGNTRVYAYVAPVPRRHAAATPAGKMPALQPDQWLEAVRKGRTFVTTGPMLEFTVNGQPPGSLIHLRKGEKLRVSARAWGEPPGTVPLQLEIVSFGRSLKKVGRRQAGDRQLEVRLELEPEHSLWITARCQTHQEQLMDVPGFFSGAVATPIYVEVDGKPCRDADPLAELVARRLESLDRIESWIRSGGDGLARGGAGSWESAAAFRESESALKAQLKAARAYYQRAMK